MFTLPCSNSARQRLLRTCLTLILFCNLNHIATRADFVALPVAPDGPVGVTALSFSQDGRFVALIRGNLYNTVDVYTSGHVQYVGGDRISDQIEIWDTSGGKLIQTFADFGGPVIDARLSPDGRFVAAATWEVKHTDPRAIAAKNLDKAQGILTLWEVGTGELRWSKQVFNVAISIVAFSPDDNSVAVIGSDGVAPGSLKIFDVRTGSMINKEGYRANAGGLAFSPDGRQLAVRKFVYNEYRSEVQIYDFPSLKERLKIVEPKEFESVPEFREYDLEYQTANAAYRIRLAELQRMAFSPDGKKLAFSLSGQKGGELVSEILCFDAQTGKPGNTITVHHEPLPTEKPVKTPVPHSGGGYLISSPLMNAIPRSRQALSAMAYLADNRSIVALNRSLVVVAWDSETGQAQRIGRSDRPASAAALSADGRMVAFSTYRGAVTLWDGATGEHKQTFGAPAVVANTYNIEQVVVSMESVLSLAYSADGRTLVSANDSNAIKLWDAPTASVRAKLARRDTAFTCVAFSPDAKRVAAGEHRGQVILFDAATGEPQRELTDDAEVHSLAFSPDGQWIAAASDDGMIRIWDAASGALKAKIEAHHGAALAVVFSPDGHRLASAGADHRITLWDAATGSAIREMSGHSDAVNAVVFSPDGKMIASAGEDKSVRVWEVETGQSVKTLTGQDGPVKAVAFSPDGRMLASGSEDGSARVWSVPEWKALHRLKGHEVAVYAVTFSPDGATLAVACGNNLIAFWNPQTGQLKRLLKEAMTVPLRQLRQL